MNNKQEPIKPGLKISEDQRSTLLTAGLSEDEIKIIEVFRYVFFGHILIHKKFGKLDGRIEFKETY